MNGKLVLAFLAASVCAIICMPGVDVEAAQGAVTGVVNINTADVAELAALPFVGPAIAQRIVDYREANGQFEKIEDIMNVKGIGEKTFQKIKDHLTVTGNTTLTSS